MLWMFERNDESLRLETRYDNTTLEFVLIMRLPDGKQQIERFKDALTFRNRLEALQAQLESEQWTAVGSPVMLRDGWKI